MRYWCTLFGAALDNPNPNLKKLIHACSFLDFFHFIICKLFPLLSSFLINIISPYVTKTRFKQVVQEKEIMSLESFFIFSEKLGLSEETETEKILFYWPSGVSMDDKLSQIGICQGLSGFAKCVGDLWGSQARLIKYAFCLLLQRFVRGSVVHCDPNQQASYCTVLPGSRSVDGNDLRLNRGRSQ
jgi:hypothetical protein